jgi:hypothetical protein
MNSYVTAQRLPLTASCSGIQETRTWWWRSLNPTFPCCRGQRVIFGFLCLILVFSFFTSLDRFCKLQSGSGSWHGLYSGGTERSKVHAFTPLTHLVIVAGNAVFTGTKFDQVGDDSQWSLEDYQRGQGATFLEHIKKAVEIVNADPDALLIFSGGKTRAQAGPLSESESYWRLASAKSWFGYMNSVSWRALTEDHARDSFENLLFSVCRFRQVTGTYPYRITMISLELKRNRIETQHRAAIRFPPSRFRFIGIDPESKVRSAPNSIAKIDRATTAFAVDPYGCFHQALVQKRMIRNPFREPIPYPAGCPEIARLFQYCSRSLYKGPLPWD